MNDKLSEKISKTEAEWKQQLTPEQYQVARACGTERAFSGQYWNKHDDGTYHCVCCGALLFGSEPDGRAFLPPPIARTSRNTPIPVMA